jgi:hypothetical protein
MVYYFLDSPSSFPAPIQYRVQTIIWLGEKGEMLNAECWLGLGIYPGFLLLSPREASPFQFYTHCFPLTPSVTKSELLMLMRHSIGIA